MAIISIAKVEDCKAILCAGDKGVIDNIFERLKQMGGEAEQICDDMQNSLHPGNKWTAWCNANLTAAEKQWLIDTYVKVKAVSDWVA